MTIMTLNPAPTAEELGTVLMERYNQATVSGLFTTQINILTLHKHIMGLRVTRGEAPVKLDVPNKAQLDDRITARLTYKCATAFYTKEAGSNVPSKWIIYDGYFGGTAIGSGPTENDAWADASQRIRNARQQTLAKSMEKSKA